MDDERLAKKFRKKLVVDQGSPTAVVVSFGRDDIKQLIPHREPFLLFDAIELVDLERRSIVGRKALAGDDPIFEGHFPGYAVYPGVLQVEMVGQLAICFYALAQAGRVEIPAEPIELGVRALKIHHALFQHELRPGDDALILGKVLDVDEYRFKGIGQVVAGGEKQRVCTVVVAEFFILD